MSLVCLGLVNGVNLKRQKQYREGLTAIARRRKRGVRFVINWKEPLLSESTYDFAISLCDNDQWDNCEELLQVRLDQWDSDDIEAEKRFRDRIIYLQEVSDYFAAERCVVDWYLGTSGDTTDVFANYRIYVNDLTNLLLEKWYKQDDYSLLHLHVTVLPSPWLD